MVRREIRSFEMLLGEEKYPCTLPCSVKSVLEAQGKECTVLGESVSFESLIYADETALAMKNIYLRLAAVSAPCEVYIGDSLVITTDGRTPEYNIDVRGLLVLGENRLALKFTSSLSGDISIASIGAAVEFIRFGGAIIDKIHLTQDHSDEGVDLGIKLDLIGRSDSVRAVATLVSPTGQIYYSGLTKGEGTIRVRDPLYWWPKGMGVQNIYKLSVNLYGESDIEDTKELCVGLRTVSLKNADSALLLINGREFLPMGATYCADHNADLILSDKKADSFISAAARSDFNCLVITADSPRPTEKLYELCDKNGILLIEEYSHLDRGDILLLDYNRHHPSLGLIDLLECKDMPDAAAVMESELSGLEYCIKKGEESYVSAPALPSMKTIRAAIPEGERTLFSRSIEAIAEDGAIIEMLVAVSQKYPYPKDLSDFAYASALAAVNKVSDSVKNSRLSMGHAGRAVYDRLCDLDMTISSSSIDSRGRWKPLQYYSSRIFSQIALYADNKDGKVSFSASNLRKIDLIGTLEYRVADSSNYTIFKASEPCEISGLSSKEISVYDFSDFIKGHESEYYLEYYLKEGSAVLSKKTLLFTPEKHFDFKKPKIKAVITGQERRFSITLSSDVFLKDLEIGFDGVDVTLSDNYLDLTSDAPVKIDINVIGGIETTYRLKDALELRSVYDLK